ncbi:hypothetical protein FOL47_004765 [Perkinsus chesapeaki]|uniref:Hexose transporter 1 n=1 Tax=Perkinsus chesapeaki TaxID=330153 RepID=A0A7J6N170_PERCH|nr:hypothetical protein FOL47_004765 [Perkinsus chesapeaki]
MNHARAVLCVAASLFGALLYGVTLAFSGPAIDTMRNTVTATDGTPIEIGDGSSLFVFPNEVDASLFGSIMNFGAIIGSLGGGPVNDRIGRKWSLFAASPLYVAAFLWIGLGTTAWQLILARFINGLALGLSTVSVPTYIGEVSPTKYRGLLGGFNQVAITSGALLVYLLGVALRTQALSTDPNATPSTFCNWRSLSFICMIPSGLLGICMFFALESPRWLAEKSRTQEAQAVLKLLRGADENNEEIRVEMTALEDIHTKNLTQGKSSFKKTIKAMGGIKMQIFIGVMLHVFQQFSGINTVIFYQTSIFQAAGVDNRDVLSLTVTIALVVSSVVSAGTVDRFGRKILLISAAAGMCFSAFCEGLFFYLREELGNQELGWLAITSAYCYTASFALAIGGIPWIMLAELFPDELRGLCTSLATAVNWFCSFLITYFLNDIRDAISFYGVFWLFSGVCLTLVIFIICMVPETKGRTFEEIQAYFQHRNRMGGRQSELSAK